jgi:S-DNA-T family DNA segregation ATPase FtsK/SpoIIIE
MNYDNLEIDVIDITHFPIFGLVGSGGMGRTSYLCYIVQSLIDNSDKEPVNIRIIDNNQKRLQLFENKITSYSTLENDIHNVINEVHGILENRGNTNSDEALECIIINSKDVYEVINGSEELSAKCREIMDKYSQRKVCVILSELPNVALKAETAPFMKLLRNKMHVMIFQQLQEQKVIDISHTIEGKYQKPLLPGEAYFKMGAYFGKYRVPYFELKNRDK